MPAKKRVGGTGKFVEKKFILDTNLLLAKYFHKMLCYQTTANQTKINELKIILCYNYELMKPSKSIIILANFLTMFGYLFEEIEFPANAKSSIHVSPCTTTMQKFHTSYMNSSFSCHLSICHHSINASICSKYYN